MKILQWFKVLFNIVTLTRHVDELLIFRRAQRTANGMVNDRLFELERMIELMTNEAPRHIRRRWKRTVLKELKDHEGADSTDPGEGVGAEVPRSGEEHRVL